jgi:adenosylcobyric acid synthase
MSARRIMIQGTGSQVGKSVLTAALCSYFREEGLRVAPFKAQNMSNNSFVTNDGKEMSRAQAFQAAACGIEPSVEMNPILLKPTTDQASQVIVLGKPIGIMKAREYFEYQPQLVSVVRKSLQQLSDQYDVVVIEGAGNPAEINLRKFDIVNMFVAKLGATPVILLADISLGGTFAWLVGTMELLEPAERALVKAFVINKFRGDISLLNDGLNWLETKTGKRVLGVLPFVLNLAIQEEDAIPEPKWKKPEAFDRSKINVAIVMLPHISNSTDFDSLDREPDVALHYLARVPSSDQALPDFLILPGSKSTVADLAYLRSSGFAKYIERCHTANVPIAGVCGGYQMMGKRLLDPMKVESGEVSTEGLGLLNLTTTFEADKQTVRVRARSLDAAEDVMGYEIHMGRTEAVDSVSPMFQITEQSGTPVNRFDGARSRDNLVWGTYIHGVFDAPGFRRHYLNYLRHRRGWPGLPQLDETSTGIFATLSALIRNHLDLDLLHRILDQT